MLRFGIGGAAAVVALRASAHTHDNPNPYVAWPSAGW